MNADDRRSKMEELDITRQELDTIGEALKNAEFRKLLCEYVDEINDPENRARNEREIELYERERGTQVTFVRPQPGYVLKTSGDGVRKVFVNVCSSDVVQRPSSSADVAGAGDHWSLPHCLSPVRQDYDRARKLCDVYDVVFHPDALDLAKRGGGLRRMVDDTALSMVERNYGVSLDRANVKCPKIQFKGVARPLILRNPIEHFQPPADDAELPGCPYQPPVRRPVQHHDLGPLKRESSVPSFTVPKYTIKYRSDIDIQEHAYNMHCKMNAVIPKELIVEIDLPLLDSSVNVELDVLPRSLKMICEKPSKYKLDVNLPYKVLEDEGNATFDQSNKKLIVRLPVSRTEPQLDYVKNLVSEVEEMPKDEMCTNGGNIVNGHLNVDQNNDQGQESVNISGKEVVVTNHLQNGNTNDHYHDTESGNSCNGSANDVHCILPEHEFIFGNKCILMLNVKNVDPTSVNVIVINDKNLISGKFHSIGSGFFPIWFAFCLQIPSKSSLFKSDIKVLPSNDNLILEFSLNLKPDCKQYWFGRDQDNLEIHNIKMETLKENMNALANGVSVALNDSDDDCDDDDIFDDSKEEIGPKVEEYRNTKKNNDNTRCKEKNGKTTKGKKKKRKKIQKSNAIPIVAAGSLPESGKKMDFMPGSLPTEFNNMRPAIRGILKKRALSESNNVDDLILSPKVYSSSVDNVDTESSDVLESSFNDLNGKKTVRFNDHVIEKKINFNISIAAQSKKHRQRQQRKRNIREYNTPSESEASEAEDRIYGPLNVVSESEETSVSESSTGEMSDDNSNSPTNRTPPVIADSKKDHKRHKSKSARKNASLAKQVSTNNLIFPIEY